MNLDDQLCFQKYLDEIVLTRGTLDGKLKCSCGNDGFYVFHNGRRTRGILGPLIHRWKDLTLFAVCSKCGNEIKILGEEISKATKEFKEENKRVELKLAIKISFWPEKFIVGRHFTNDWEYLDLDATSKKKKYENFVAIP